MAEIIVLGVWTSVLGNYLFYIIPTTWENWKLIQFLNQIVKRSVCSCWDVFFSLIRYSVCKSVCLSVLVDMCWFLVVTDTCILHDKNITSVKNSSFCLSAQAIGNLTKLVNMTFPDNKTYVSPSEEYFK